MPDGQNLLRFLHPKEVGMVINLSHMRKEKILKHQSRIPGKQSCRSLNIVQTGPESRCRQWSGNHVSKAILRWTLSSGLNTSHTALLAPQKGHTWSLIDRYSRQLLWAQFIWGGKKWRFSRPVRYSCVFPPFPHLPSIPWKMRLTVKKRTLGASHYLRPSISS